MTSETPLGIIIETNFRDELPRLEAAAKRLGGISIRVVDDLGEASSLLRAQQVARMRLSFPEESEQRLKDSAATIWPEDRVGQFIGPEAVHAVTEITFYQGHSLMDLHHTARHGEVFGRGQVS